MADRKGSFPHPEAKPVGGKPAEKKFGKPAGNKFGKSAGGKFGKPAGRSFGKPGERKFGKPADGGHRSYPHPETKPADGRPEARPVGEGAPRREFAHPEAKPVSVAPRREFAHPEARPVGETPRREFHRAAPRPVGEGAPRREFAHPEAKPVGEAPRREFRRADAKPFRRDDSRPSFPRGDMKPPRREFTRPRPAPAGDAPTEEKPRFARPIVRPAGPVPHERSRRAVPSSRAPARPAENPRQTALNILQDVTRADAYASLALGERLRASKLAQRDRDFVSALVYGTLEKQLTLDWLIDGKLEHDGALDPLVRDMLRMGLYQILYMTRVPDSAAVDESVKLAHAMHREAQAGFVNALLRSFAREKDEIAWPDRDAEPARYLSLRHSLPQWIAEKLIEEYGFGEAEDIASYEPPIRPIAVRRSPDKTSPREFEAMMTEKGWAWQPSRLPDMYLVTDGIGDVGIEKEYLRGLYSVQGESSALCALCVSPQRGMSVLDACAAPGGKTACMAEAMRGTGRVYAWDKHDHRVELIRSMVKRLRLDNVRPAVRDAACFKQDLELSMDAVLVDAPCSGLGVMLSKPDVKYRQTPESVASLAREQAAILNTCCRYVRPGGILIYSTCTLLHEENAGQVEAFLQAHPEFEPDAEGLLAALPVSLQERAHGHMLQLQAHRDGMDGFFIARLRRKNL